jgi:hypothetical protein
MTDLSALAQHIQEKLRARAADEVDAVTAARNRLRRGEIIGSYQTSSGRWFIRRLRS